MFAFGFAITSGDIYDNSWALIIGINKYQNVQKLDFAADDAIAMKDILIESFNFPEHNITILLNEEATKDNIVKEKNIFLLVVIIKIRDIKKNFVKIDPGTKSLNGPLNLPYKPSGFIPIISPIKPISLS